MPSVKKPAGDEPEKNLTELKEWLEEGKFSDCYNALVKDGVVQLADLIVLTESDIKEMVSEWGFGLWQRLRFNFRIEALRETMEPGDLWCKKHRLPFRYHCTQDDELICMDCFAIGHPGHPCRSLEEAYAEKRKKCSDFLAVASRSNDEHQQDVDEAKDLQQQDTTMREAAITAVSAFFSQLRAACDEREAELVQALQARSQTAKIEAHITKAEAARVSVTQGIKNLTELVEADRMELLVLADDLQEQVQSHLAVEAIAGVVGSEIELDVEAATAAIRAAGVVLDVPLTTKLVKHVPC